ncbi:hypothetical protein V1478_001675 [Vespula squamosa]|uniref:Uncharacterized protein n=1 Tax=Vespula squamosa TaxID=30214 RepID=A0ABD2BXT0_VESSQ
MYLLNTLTELETDLNNSNIVLNDHYLGKYIRYTLAENRVCKPITTDLASNNIPLIKIANNSDSFNIQQQQSFDIESRQKRITNLAGNPTMEREMETDSESSQNWKSVKTSNKKRKVMKSKKLCRIDYDLKPQDKWLLDKISPTNSFDLLPEEDNGPLEPAIKKKKIPLSRNHLQYI